MRTLPLLLFLLFPSCILVAAGAVAAGAVGAVSYSNNEAWMDTRASLKQAWDASLTALGEQGYAVQGSPALQATEGTIEAKDAKVIVEQHPGDYVRIRVRIGTFDTKDNERKARLLIEAIKQKTEKK